MQWEVETIRCIPALNNTQAEGGRRPAAGPAHRRLGRRVSHDADLVAAHLPHDTGETSVGDLGSSGAEVDVGAEQRVRDVVHVRQQTGQVVVEFVVAERLAGSGQVTARGQGQARAVAEAEGRRSDRVTLQAS